MEISIANISLICALLGGGGWVLSYHGIDAANLRVGKNLSRSLIEGSYVMKQTPV